MSDRWKLCLFWGNMSHILDLMLQGRGGAGWTRDCRGVSEGALAFQNWSECPFNFWRQPFSPPLSLKRREREAFAPSDLLWRGSHFLLGASPFPYLCSHPCRAGRGSGRDNNAQFIKRVAYRHTSMHSHKHSLTNRLGLWRYSRSCN